MSLGIINSNTKILLERIMQVDLLSKPSSFAARFVLSHYKESTIMILSKNTTLEIDTLHVNKAFLIVQCAKEVLGVLVQHKYLK